MTSFGNELFPGFGETYAMTTEGGGRAVISRRSGSAQRIGGSLEESGAGEGGSASPSRYIISVSEVDPDEIRAALRQHSQRVIHVERQRVSTSVITRILVLISPRRA